MARVGQAAETADTDDMGRQLHRLEWWQDHTKGQLVLLWELLESRLDEAARLELVEQLGRNCAKRIGWANEFKGNVRGFFQRMKENQGEVIEFDEAAGVITITSPERDCVCAMVDSKRTPAYFCHCSVGWQKETYETILGRKVEVEVTESVLKGSKRCVFEVRLV